MLQENLEKTWSYTFLENGHLARKKLMVGRVRHDFVVFFTVLCHVKWNLFIVSAMIKLFLSVVERELLNALPLSEQCSPDEAELVQFSYVNILNKVRLCLW